MGRDAASGKFLSLFFSLTGWMGRDAASAPRSAMRERTALDQLKVPEGTVRGRTHTPSAVCASTSA
eukprot:15478349-Alexandrium_andersonii.AAC.1